MELIEDIQGAISGILFAVFFWETIVARKLGVSVVSVLGISYAARYLASRRARESTYKTRNSSTDNYYEDS